MRTAMTVRRRLAGIGAFAETPETTVTVSVNGFTARLGGRRPAMTYMTDSAQRTLGSSCSSERLLKSPDED